MGSRAGVSARSIQGLTLTPKPSQCLPLITPRFFDLNTAATSITSYSDLNNVYLLTWSGLGLNVTTFALVASFDWVYYWPLNCRMVAG